MAHYGLTCISSVLYYILGRPYPKPTSLTNPTRSMDILPMTKKSVYLQSSTVLQNQRSKDSFKLDSNEHLFEHLSSPNVFLAMDILRLTKRLELLNLENPQGYAFDLESIFQVAASKFLTHIHCILDQEFEFFKMPARIFL